MSTMTPPTCEHGLTREAVAAWHDGALDAAATERLAAHLATCPACRAHLADFEEVERLVREERVPEPGEGLWQAVRAAAPRHRMRQFTIRGVPPLAGGLGAVAAVLLLALGFSVLFRTLGARPITTVAPTATAQPSPTDTATPSPTSTPPPIATGTPLSWQPVSLPPGMTGIGRTDALAPSGANGNTAYACFIAQNGSTFEAQVWVTHDAAQSWTRVATPANGALGSCSLAVDAADANVVVLGTGGQGAPPHQTDFYLTTDGGASWRTLPQGFSVASLVTYEHAGAHIYAITDQQQSDASILVRLQRSDDGGATWTPIDAGLRSEGVVPQALWVRPDTGVLLVSVVDHINEPQLWTSDDGGSTWGMLTGMQGGVFIVATPHSGQPWQICGVAKASPNANHIEDLICPLNGDPRGSWGPRPNLITSGAFNENATYLALLPDGSILASAPDSADATADTFRVYRLPPGATTWENVGPGPEVRITAALTAGNTTLLWAEPTFGGVLDPQGRVFVAQVSW